MTMQAPSWNRGGDLVDLANPGRETIDFAGIAGSLSKIVRWAGRHDGPGFSVAQHCVMGADAIFAETSDHVAAGAFVVHDAHEGNGIGDIVTPAVLALACIAKDHLGPTAADAFHAIVADLKRRHDIAICDAAGIDWRLLHLGSGGLFAQRIGRNVDPQARLRARIVKAMDGRMADAEAHYLFGPKACPRPDPYPKFTGALKPWGPAKAEEAWLDRLDRYLGVKP